MYTVTVYNIIINSCNIENLHESLLIMAYTYAICMRVELCSTCTCALVIDIMIIHAIDIAISITRTCSRVCY